MQSHQDLEAQRRESNQLFYQSQVQVQVGGRVSIYIYVRKEWIDCRVELFFFRIYRVHARVETDDVKSTYFI